MMMQVVKVICFTMIMVDVAYLFGLIVKELWLSLQRHVVQKYNRTHRK